MELIDIGCNLTHDSFDDDRDAVIEDLDYRSRTGLDRSQLASLASCDWIRAHQSLLIQGATGSGKTYLACALAHQACRQGLSARCDST